MIDKLIPIILTSALLLSCSYEQEGVGYTITIKFEEDIPEFITDRRIVIESEDPLLTLSDTATVVKKSATLYGTVVYPNLCTIRTIGINPQTATTRTLAEFFLENAPYTITVSQDRSKVPLIYGGGELNKEMDSLTYKTKQIFERENMDSLYKVATTSQYATNKIAEVENSVREMVIDYINSHPDSYLSLYLISQMADYLPLDSLRRIVAKLNLNDELASTSYMHKIEAAEKRLTALQEGKINIVVQTPQGEDLNLNEYYATHQCTLLQFWASWCEPSREYNKILRKLYSKFRRKGLGIVSISLDTEKKAWTDAIVQDRLTWPQGSDLKGLESEICKTFSICSLPASYLIDSAGRVLLSNPKEETINPYLVEKLKFNTNYYLRRVEATVEGESQ